MSGRKDSVSVIELLNTLLRHRRTVVGLPISFAVLFVGFGLITSPTYTTTVSFTPQAESNQLADLGGIAAEFGVRLPQDGASHSPQFYADILMSRRLLERAVTDTYLVPAEESGHDAATRGNLMELYEIEAPSRPRRLDDAIKTLRSDVEVQTMTETGVVEFTVRAPWPSLSENLGQRLLELINEFNLEVRQSQASAEREFLTGRVQQARRDLRVAEDSLRQFLEQNRSFEGSPRLRFEHDRLQRRVDLQQQVYTSLVESSEQAKIEEVRNVPVITVVEPPVPPSKPDSRHLLVKGILGVFVGGLVALIWSLGHHFFALARVGDADEQQELQKLMRDSAEDVRRLWRKTRDLVAGGGAGSS